MNLRAYASTPVRWWAAAIAAILPLGLVWSSTPGSVRPAVGGAALCVSGAGCTPGANTPSVPGHTILGSQSEARLFLVAAAVALVVAASSARTGATVRVARWGVGALVVAGVLALSQRATPGVVCVIVALALAGPPVLRRRRDDTPVLVSGQRRA